MSVKAGETIQIKLHIRNFTSRKQAHRIEMHAPPSLSVTPAVLEGTVAGEARESFPIRLQADANASTGVRIIAFDVTRDGQRLGEWFDCIVNVTSKP
jgi:hypothetical protein